MSQSRKRSRTLLHQTFFFGCIRFSVQQCPSKVSITASGDFESKDTDTVGYVLHFRPPLTRAQAHSTRVCITYCGDKVQRAASSHIFMQHIIPHKHETGILHTLLKNELEYELYETHQLRVHHASDTVSTMYITLENNMIEADYDLSVFIENHVDTTLFLMPRLIPGRFLMWFPPDVDPKLYGLFIDPQLIPQHCPLWFKLRAEVSGFKAYVLLGFFVPRPGTKEAQNYSFYSREFSRDDTSRARMRLGSISEELALITYCSHFKHVTFDEMGSVAATAPYPVGWGASPDGLLHMKEPPFESKDYPELEGRRGACEIKTSRTQTTASAYFIPQMYMEMIALQATWAHLIRFHRPKHDTDTAYVYECRRDRSLEDSFIRLWMHALNNVHSLVQTVMEPEFVKMRAHLEKLAKGMPLLARIPAPEKATHMYWKHLERVRTVNATDQDMGDIEDELLWADVDARHKKLMTRPSTKLIAQQIEAYSVLMQNALQ